MGPKVVPLSLAGRKLVQGPEGFNRKKELAVRDWLKRVPELYDNGLA